MSIMILQPSTIEKLSNNNLESIKIASGNANFQYEDYKKLLQRLYDLNIRSWNERYPNEDKEKFYGLNFDNDRKFKNDCSIVETLQCLNYNIDIEEKSCQDNKAIEILRNYIEIMRNNIINNLDDYKNSGWGYDRIITKEKNENTVVKGMEYKQELHLRGYTEKEIETILPLLENQTEENCMLLIKIDANLLELISNQTEEVCLEAVRKFSHLLFYVKNQTMKICMEVGARDYNGLRWVRDKTTRTMLQKNKYIEERRIANKLRRMRF